jgi:tetratricopeptide (TPR) repeat protein
VATTLCLALAMGASRPPATAPPAAAGNAASQQPAAAEPRTMQEAWNAYIAGARWREGKEFFAARIVDACKAPGGPNAQALADLHYAYNICRYFPHAARTPRSRKDQQRLVNWLLGHPEFTEPFLLALGPDDNWTGAFVVLHALLERHAALVLRNSELAIAFSVVWDAQFFGREQAAGSFVYFIENAGSMTYVPGTFPHEMSKFIVDTRRPLDERLWALGKYGRDKDIGRLYTKLWRYEYDYRAFLYGKEKKVAKHGATLQNIAKHGGTCHEAGVFATEVGKAIGVPSVYVYGDVPGGTSHCWPAFLREARGRYRWELDTGRVGNEDVVVGWMRDPQSGQEVPEHELDFLLAGLGVPAQQRRAARMWSDVARILADAEAAKPAVAAMRASLNSCVCDRGQWQTYAWLADRGMVPPADLEAAIGKFVDVLGPYPLLAVEAFEALIAPLAKLDADAALRAFDRAANLLGDNQEALGWIMVLKGRWIEKRGDVRGAWAIYHDYARDLVATRSVALALLDNAGRLAIQERKLEAALELHRSVRSRTRKPQAIGGGRATTWFAVTLRLAKLNQRAGDHKRHDKLVDQLADYGPGTDTDRRAAARQFAGLTYEDVTRGEHRGPP